MSADAAAAAARQRDERRELLGAGPILPDLLGPDSGDTPEDMQRLLHADELQEAAAAAAARVGGNAGAAAATAAGAPTGAAATWVEGLLMPPAAAAAAAAAGSRGLQRAAVSMLQAEESAEGVVLGRLGEALVRQVLDAAAAAAVQEETPSTAAQQQQQQQHGAAAAAATALGRRSAAHREWLGSLPPGVPSGVLLPGQVPGQVEQHLWGRPTESVLNPARNGQGVATQGRQQGLGLEVRGVGIWREPEGVRGGGSAGLRCPICRAAVEQSVSNVLIV